MNERTETQWEQRLGDGLNVLADHVESAGPTATATATATVTVTVRQIIRDGQAQLRLRRRRTAFALSAALVTATALTFGVLAATGGSKAEAPALNDRPTSTASLGGTDPASPTISFGWLPAGFDGDYSDVQDAAGPNFVAGVNPTTKVPQFNGPGDETIGVNGPGGQSFGAYIQGPDAGLQPGVKLTPAGVVQGHQAWWESDVPGSASAISDKQLMLDWHYEPNAWATVMYSGHADAAAGVATLKVADSLEIGPTHPSPMPFQLSLPAGLHVDAVSIGTSSQYDAHVGDASLRLCLTSPCPDNGGLVVSQTAPKWFSPAPGLSSLMGTGYGPPLGFSGSSEHVTVDGHSAQLWANAIEAWLSFTDGGSQLDISASGAEYQALGGRDGFLAFCRSVTWLGANPADWTTDVVR